MSITYFYEPNETVPFNYFSSTRTMGQITLPYENSKLPIDYLEFAVNDFKEGSARGLVNAFGNAKRALHLAIDTVLHQYGLFKYYKKANFPTKLKVLDDIGIFPTNIIKNLNVERNLIEHEYDTPNRKRVAEAIDVVQFLILVIEKLMENTIYEAVVGWKNPKKHCVLQLEPVLGLINIFTMRAKGKKGKYRKTSGINYFCGVLRDFNGNLSQNIQISQTPWKTIILKKAKLIEWKDIIAEMVSLQRYSGYNRKTVIDDLAGTITTSITVPLSHFQNKPLSKIIDDSIKKLK